MFTVFLVDIIYILLKNRPTDEGHRREHNVVQRDVRSVKEALSGEAAIEGEVELWNREDHILVEKVEDHLCDADVVPTAVNQQQPPQPLELRQSVVAGLYSAHSFLAIQAYTNMGHLYHRYVIRTVTD